MEGLIAGDAGGDLPGSCELTVAAMYFCAVGRLFDFFFCDPEERMEGGGDLRRPFVEERPSPPEMCRSSMT